MSEGWDDGSPVSEPDGTGWSGENTNELLSKLNKLEGYLAEDGYTYGNVVIQTLEEIKDLVLGEVGQ